MCLLTRCDVLSGLCNFDNGDIVIMPSEELLGSSDDVSHNEGGPQWVDDVLVVGVKDKTASYLT